MTTVTDAEGRYALLSVPVDGEWTAYVVAAQRAGFESSARAIVAVAGGSLTVDIVLSPATPPVEETPPVAETDIVVTSSSFDEVMCVAAGDELDYEVAIANEGTATEAGIVLHDTLEDGFSRDLVIADIVVDRENFPDAVVVVNPGGRSFRVALGPLPPMPARVVYAVGLPAAANLGNFCNAVSAVGAGGSVLARDRNCIVTPLVLKVGRVNEDGAIVGGEFTAAPDTFRVGAGGALDPGGLVFRVGVTNAECYPLESVRLTSVPGARSGAVEFRAFLAGFPNQGRIESANADGFVWDIGRLDAGEGVELLFRAEAVAAGDDVNRIAVTSPDFAGELIREEPVTVIP